MLGVVSVSCGASSSCAKQQLHTVQRYATPINLKWCDKQLTTHHAEKYQCAPTRSVPQNAAAGETPPTQSKTEQQPTQQHNSTTQCTICQYTEESEWNKCEPFFINFQKA
jgi:hypothetical protein